MPKKRERVVEGAVFEINCGTKLTVKYFVSNSIVGVEDESGYVKEVRVSQLVTGSLDWKTATVPFSNFADRRVGEEFKLKCGVVVKVVDYKRATRVTVEDSYGNRKTTKYEKLKTGVLSWNSFLPDDSPYKVLHPENAPSVKVGDVFLLNCGVSVVVTRYTNRYCILVEDCEGNIKECTTSSLKSGSLSWSEFGHTSSRTLREKVPIGKVFESKVCGRFTILKVYGAKNITVCWELTEHIQQNCTKSQVLSGNLQDESVQKATSLRLNYVYHVFVNGDLAYIGKGKGKRYLHPKSGASSCAELNRHYFLGDKIEVVILKDGLSSIEASKLEKDMIWKMQPKYNKKYNNG